VNPIPNPDPNRQPKPSSADVAERGERGVASIGVRSLGNPCVLRANVQRANTPFFVFCFGSDKKRFASLTPPATG
jgi:hypothetical protein